MITDQQFVDILTRQKAHAIVDSQRAALITFSKGILHANWLLSVESPNNPDKKMLVTSGPHANKVSRQPHTWEVG